ncbi:hypothetical protein [Lysobacter sp. FW306-1B-D06B]|uniref:hypothetical protein n=1 Tax=Lysobacter sp. FW306-1B-D06B TaxID=3140250 RepID=UPI0031400278
MNNQISASNISRKNSLAKRKIAAGLLSMLVLASSLPAYAAGSSQGSINQVLFMPIGAVLVVPAQIATPAACNTARRFAINTNDASGKAQLAGLLSAQASGKSVTIYGTGECNIWGDSESVQILVLQ